MFLPKTEEINVVGKRVLLRMDLDVSQDFTRIELSADTLRYLKEKDAKIIIIGHKGRPGGAVDKGLSLERLAPVISKVIGMEVEFVGDVVGEEARRKVNELTSKNILLLENLRFNSGEEENSEDFVKKLASFGDFYVNEAFAVAHRDHASITGLPKLMPHAAGIRFAKEVSVLSDVWEKPKRPIVAVISGVKKDKIQRIASILDIVDQVLVGGRLPIYLDQANPQNLREEFTSEDRKAIDGLLKNQKLIVGQLISDTEDITMNSIEKFKGEIHKAKTIILAGVPGRYEDEGHRQGTKEVFEAVANSPAFKIAGGGDAEAAITLLGLNDKFDWISVGGGAMLEFLAKKTLPGIEALLL